MQSLNFCFKRSNFDQFLNKIWCPQCCDCPEWCKKLKVSEGFKSSPLNSFLAQQAASQAAGGQAASQAAGGQAASQAVGGQAASQAVGGQAGQLGRLAGWLVKQQAPSQEEVVANNPRKIKEKYGLIQNSILPNWVHTYIISNDWCGSNLQAKQLAKTYLEKAKNKNLTNSEENYYLQQLQNMRCKIFYIQDMANGLKFGYY